MQLLRQPNNSPMSLHQQVITLICAQARLFVQLPVKEIREVLKDLLEYFEAYHGAICHKIEHGRVYSEELREEIIDRARKFMAAR